MNALAVPVARELLVGNGRIYACGTYFPRQHKMHWHCAWSQAIWKCKHGNSKVIRDCGRVMANLLDAALPSESAFVITYVPSEAGQRPTLGRSSRSAAEPLAYAVFEALAHRRSVSIEPLIAPVRLKARKQHLCTSHQERRQNVIGCFAVTRPALGGASVIVIDDVATSGATIRECHRVLLKAGASDVIGCVLARTIGW